MARFCTSCGAPLGDDAEFCTACGAAQNPSQQPAANAQQAPANGMNMNNFTEAAGAAAQNAANAVKNTFDGVSLRSGTHAKRSRGKQHRNQHGKRPCQPCEAIHIHLRFPLLFHRSIPVVHLLREAQDIPELDRPSVVQNRFAAHAAKDLVLI